MNLSPSSLDFLLVILERSSTAMSDDRHQVSPLAIRGQLRITSNGLGCRDLACPPDRPLNSLEKFGRLPLPFERLRSKPWQANSISETRFIRNAHI